MHICISTYEWNLLWSKNNCNNCFKTWVIRGLWNTPSMNCFFFLMLLSAEKSLLLITALMHMKWSHGKWCEGDVVWLHCYNNYCTKNKIHGLFKLVNIPRLLTCRATHTCNCAVLVNIPRLLTSRATHTCKYSTDAQTFKHSSRMFSLTNIPGLLTH